jgi:uncharacterized phage protein (TIGR01671 family)
MQIFLAKSGEDKMREIKFRAWDTELKEMSFSDPLDDFERAYSWFLSLEDMDISNNIVLMQFAGLRDKNGKEIYEGDIVHCWSEYDDGKRVIDHGIWEVYWRTDRWHLRRNGRFGEEWWDNGDYYQGDEVYWNEPEGSNRMEVIGNIYENPELLEAK